MEKRLNSARDQLETLYKHYVDTKNDGPGMIKVQRNLIEAISNNKLDVESKHNQILSKLSQIEGVAYKVRVDSTNKGGEEIHNIWTITALQDEKKQWKVTFIYDEKDFKEKTYSTQANDLLSMMDIHID